MLSLAVAALVCAAPPAPTAGERAVSGGAAALGAVAGAVLGSSAALGMGASLAGFNDAVSTVPELALPPALAAIGAGAAGAAAGGAGAGWAAGIGALAGGGVATLTIALTTVEGGGLAAQNERFATIVLFPAALSAAVAGAGAAVFAQGVDDAQGTRGGAE